MTVLEEKEKRQIDAEAEHLPRRRAAVVEALKIVQRHRRWVDDEAVRDVAEYLDMSPSEVDSVATFYNLIFRRPVGRHVILLCNSVSCWLMGCDRVRDRLRERLGVGFGETTDDERFTVLPMACLGACDHAPVLMVDEDTHRDVSEEDLDELLEPYE